MNLHSIHCLVPNSLLICMKWSLRSIHLELSHYDGGMQTYFEHIFSLFQACVKLKPISSIVSHISRLCKNETTFKHSFPCFKLLKKWNHSHFIPFDFHFYWPFFPKWALVFSFNLHHLLVWSYAFTWFLPFLEELLRWVVLLSYLLTFSCFEQFHHYCNHFLPFIPLVPLGVLFHLFLDSQNMKRLLRTCLFELIKVN